MELYLVLRRSTAAGTYHSAVPYVGTSFSEIIMYLKKTGIELHPQKIAEIRAETVNPGYSDVEEYLGQNFRIVRKLVSVTAVSFD